MAPTAGKKAAPAKKAAKPAKEGGKAGKKSKKAKGTESYKLYIFKVSAARWDSQRHRCRRHAAPSPGPRLLPTPNPLLPCPIVLPTGAQAGAP